MAFFLQLNPYETLLKTTSFSFVNTYQLQNDFELGMGSWVHFSSQFQRLTSGAKPCWPHACCPNSLWVHMCLEDLVLLVSFISSGSSSISMLCSAGFPDRYTRDFMENITFRREFSRISHSLHFSTCGPFYWFSSNAGDFPDDCWAIAILKLYCNVSSSYFIMFL